MLDRDEYVEQAFFFSAFRERVETDVPAQDALAVLRAEVLAATKLPMAIELMLTEVKHSGLISPAMLYLKHYFTPFQAYVIQKSEESGERLDFRIALRILENEAKYRSESPTPQGLFFYEFETLCRNKLGYEDGLTAISRDAVFDIDWRNWILSLHDDLGVVDFAEMIFQRSEFFVQKSLGPTGPLLFSEREGRIAHATIGRDPVYLFSALSRHLNYPAVPRQQRVVEEESLIPQLKRRIELLENRLILLEEESRGGINLNRYYARDE